MPRRIGRRASTCAGSVYSCVASGVGNGRTGAVDDRAEVRGRMSRRRKGPKVVRVAVMFLGVVALVGTMTTLAGAVPSGVTAKSAPPSSGSVASINHVVVLMQENRSYDSYFSRLHFQGQPQASVESQKPNPNPFGGPADPSVPDDNAVHHRRSRSRLGRDAQRDRRWSHGRLHRAERGPDRSDG